MEWAFKKKKNKMKIISKLDMEGKISMIDLHLKNDFKICLY